MNIPLHAASASSTENATWKDVLASEKNKEYFTSLLGFVESERALGKSIYPKNSEVFNALSLTPFNEVKVVILGQDPYHGPRQAHGLCFSVLPPTPPPPSLVNIFTELKSDLGCIPPKDGLLEAWAKQGVLLLNSVLTVEDGRPGSHAHKGWEQFTDRVIAELNEKRDGLVFMLWGSYAQKKASYVDSAKHCVLSAPHPSPLSAYRGFFGCRHFSKANNFLAQRGMPPIHWQL